MNSEMTKLYPISTDLEGINLLNESPIGDLEPKFDYKKKA